MHETVTKRLFVGGLASDVTSEEIYERFSRFGKVSNLSMKTRKDELGNKLKCFAHLDIEGDEGSIKKCFSTYQNAKWKGTLLQLQYAKEHFLQKLEKEIKETKSQQEVVKVDKPSHKPQAELLELKGQGVPGTPVPGKKDWVVGKYGRVLPVLKLKKSYTVKMMKYDPSKYCHAAKIFKDDLSKTSAETPCAQLTWEINTQDTEITKKRKGTFLDTPQSSKKVKMLSVSDFYKSNEQIFPKDNNDEVEIVKVGSGNSAVATKLNISNKFDSESESGSEDVISIDDVVAGLETKKRTTPRIANKNMNVKDALKSPIKSTTVTEVKRSNKKTVLKSQSKSVSQINNNSNVKRKSNGENPISRIARSNPALMTETASTAKNNKSLLAAKKNSSVVTDFDSYRKIPEFQGLGMIGLLSKSSRVSETKSEHVSEAPLNSSQVLKAPNTQESDKSAQPREVNIKPSPDRHNIASESLSATFTVSKNISHEALSSAISNHTAPWLKENLIKYTQMSSDNSKEKPANIEPKQQTIVLSSSVLEENYRKDYDSSSSADTDEIIARCKHRKSLPFSSKEVKELPSATGNTFDMAGKSSLRQGQCDSDQKLIRLAPVDHNLELSEFSSGISDYLEQPASLDLTSQNGISDLYDSDLDSNDFALVAKKLAERALTSQTVGSKRLSVKMKERNTLSQNHNSFRTNHQQNKESKLSVRSDERTTTDVITTKSNPLVPMKSFVKDSNIVNKQAADNEKRLQAIRENMKLKQKQQSISRDTFKNVDSRDGSIGTRVVFSSSDDESSNDVDNYEDTTTRISDKSKLELFDSSSDGEEEDFAEIFKSKPHFEGQKGEKLMRLEQRIADPRFKLDAKFAVSDSEEDEQLKKTTAINSEVNRCLEEEKTTNLRILENVIGKTTLERFSEKLQRKTKHIIDMNAVRFDPTKVQKPETVSEVDKKLQKEKKTASKTNPTEKWSLQAPKIEEQHTRHKIDDKPKRKDQTADKINTKIEVSFNVKQNLVTDVKKQGKVELKSEATNANGAMSNKADIRVSSSLVDLFKKKNESIEETQCFSLLQQFDMEEDNGDMDHIKEDCLLSSPLSALLKKGMDHICDNQTATAYSESVQSAEKSSSEIDSTSGDTSDEEDAVTEEIGKPVEPTSKRESFAVDEEDSMEESDDRSHLSDDDRDENELISAGRVDVRYTKDQWLQRWEDLRPALVKMYKRKHKDALRNKRKSTEMKRQKEFLKRHHWVRKRVS